MNPIAALLVGKVVEFLLDKHNIEKFIGELLSHIPNFEEIPGVPEAIGKLKVETNEDNLENLGCVLESTGALEADKYASLLINNTTVKV